MELAGLVFNNLLFYRKKILPVLVLCGLILSLPLVSYFLVRQITLLADRPLASLKTQLILQQESGDKDAAAVKTRGLIEPFNLQHFTRQSVKERLSALKGIEQYSTALVLWEFDPQNTLTVVGLDVSDPQVGLRRIQSLLMPGGRFFSGNRANEVILERHFAALFGYKIGHRFPLAGNELQIIGLVDFTEQSNLSNAAVFMPYETALSLSHSKDRVVNQVFIDLTASTVLGGARQDLATLFPGFSLISRDSLYKNLSAFNRLIFQGGNLLVVLVTPLALLLLFGLLKMHRLEFADQIRILAVLGWSKSHLRQWRLWDLGCLLFGGVLLAVIIGILVYFLILPQLQLVPLLNQGFQP